MNLEVFDLQHSVPEFVVVANSFHTKPLLRILQAADRYQILCLNRQKARLYEGNRHALDPVELTDVPTTITEALGNELTEPHLSVASYGALRTPYSPHGEPAMRHGHGSKKDELDADIERFFRVIDREIVDRYCRRSGLPLLLAALPEYHATFRQACQTPLLLDRGIMINPDALSLEELREQSWLVLEPFYRERLDKLVENHRLARSRQLGADDLAEVAQAAVVGRVGTLLVEADRQIPGKIDPATGQVELRELSDPEIDDILDDLAQMVMRTKGEVVVVSADRMPSHTGVAATYRF